VVQAAEQPPPPPPADYSSCAASAADVDNLPPFLEAHKATVLTIKQLFSEAVAAAGKEANHTQSKAATLLALERRFLEIITVARQEPCHSHSTGTRNATRPRTPQQNVKVSEVSGAQPTDIESSQVPSSAAHSNGTQVGHE
jgi:hypothetical protein